MAALFKRAASAESVLSGLNPSEFSTTDPIRLFIIQAVIIIVLCRLLAWPFRKINQPAVIAEVIAGIILGPTALGKIPHFSETIFPPQSLAYLNLVATLGLVLFLFIVGLEVDLRVMKKGAKLAASVSFLGLAIPFGLGAAISKGVYDHFIDPKAVSFGHFLLFTGVAMAITAFPVLARILSETKLLYTRVGIVTLAAGVGNDVVGWVLLALSVALINASSGVVAVYILLCSVGWALVLFYLIRPAFIWLARRTGSLDQGPTQLMITITLLLVLLSAWITDILGVHAIFGAFLVGLMVPHEGGFAAAMTEKIEDLVTVVFLPLYFTLSGLRTDLTTLNSGIAWGYTIAIVAIAFFSKFGGCFGAAKLFKMSTREAAAIGTLMSCKGLVELIVLNIGLQAGALNTRVFSMYVLMAVISTVITTPLVLWIYPEKHRQPAGDKAVQDMADLDLNADAVLSSSKKLMIVLSGMEQLPGLMHFVQLIKPTIGNMVTSETPLPQQPGRAHSRSARSPDDEKEEMQDQGDVSDKATSESDASSAHHLIQSSQAPLTIDAHRLVELSDRTSALIRVAEIEDTLRADPVLNVFRSFGQLSRVDVRPSISVVPLDQFPPTLVDRARKTSSDLMILPWVLPSSDRASSAPGDAPAVAPPSMNPFGSLFGGHAGQHHPSSSENQHNARSATQYSALARRLIQNASCDVGLLVDQSDLPKARFGQTSHLLLAFVGGPDDRAALQYAARFAVINTDLRVTVLHLQRVSAEEAGQAAMPSVHSTQHHTHHHQQQSSIGYAATGLTVQDTVYRSNQGPTGLQAALDDDIALQRVKDSAAFAQGRITIQETSTSRPLHDLIKTVERENPSLVVVGRGRKNPTGGSHRDELRALLTWGIDGPSDQETPAHESRQGSESLSKPQSNTETISPVLAKGGESSTVKTGNENRVKLANSETCKVIGEAAFALSLSKCRVTTLIIASANKPNNQQDV
ncbi:unnamed protein product [Sympodiomycopsis kandeliae]